MSRERLLIEEFKESWVSLGRYWINAAGSNCLKQWGEEVVERDTVKYTNVKGAEGVVVPVKSPVRLLRKGVTVALVGKSMTDSGNPILQLQVDPSITRERIDHPEILKMIPLWIDASKEGGVVCGEIADLCRKLEIDGHMAEAVGLYVYLLRTGWTRT